MSYRKIVWRDEYYIGIDLIDQQHKKWLEIANKYLEAKENHSEAEVLKSTLTELVEYTKYHLHTEEKEMLNSGYKTINSHKLLHKKLTDQVVQILEHLKEGRLNAVEELSLLLRDWLINHILHEDKEFGEHLRKS